jgi:hypothetical protein
MWEQENKNSIVNFCWVPKYNPAKVRRTISEIMSRTVRVYNDDGGDGQH